MNALGEAGARDYEAAYFWLLLAEPLRPTAAGYYFELIEPELSADVITSALARARRWRPREPIDNPIGRP